MVVFLVVMGSVVGRGDVDFGVGIVCVVELG